MMSDGLMFKMEEVNANDLIDSLIKEPFQIIMVFIMFLQQLSLPLIVPIKYL